MDLLQSVKTFLQVVESRSFADAARRLDVSTAAVSRQVAFLERTLGARLLNRTTRRLNLTEIGQACYERYVRIVTGIEEVREIAQAGTVTPQGTLRVSSVMLFWMLRIAPVLPEFLERYPKLSVQVTLTERVVDLVEEGFDLSLQFGPPLAKTLVGRRVVPIHRVLYAAPDYLRRHGRPKSPADLLGHNCLIYAALSESVDWEFRHGGETKVVPVNGNLRTNDAITIRSAAVRGLGIARGPVYLVQDDLESNRLVQVLPQYAVTPLELWATYPSRQLLPAKVRVFIDFLEEKLGRDPTLNRILPATPHLTQRKPRKRADS